MKTKIFFSLALLFSLQICFADLDFIGDSTISENLFKYYVDLYHDNTSTFDFSNIDVDSMVLFTTPSESSWLTPQNEWGKIVEGVDMGDGAGIFKENSFETYGNNKGFTIVVTKDSINSNDKLIEALQPHIYRDLDGVDIQFFEDNQGLEWFAIIPGIDVPGDVIFRYRDCRVGDYGYCAISFGAFFVPGVSAKAVKEVFKKGADAVGGIVEFTKIVNRYGASNVYHLLTKVNPAYYKKTLEHIDSRQYNSNQIDGLSKLIQKEGDIFNDNMPNSKLDTIYESLDNNIEDVGNYYKLNLGSRGQSGEGWEHIVERHVGTNANSQYKFKNTDGTFMSSDEVKELLGKILKEGKTQTDNKGAFVRKTINGISYRAGVDTNKNIVVTFYPEVIQ